MSLAVAYISKNGKVAAVHESSHGNWEFFEVILGTSTNVWRKIDGPYAEWEAEMLHMAEKLSERYD